MSLSHSVLIVVVAAVCTYLLRAAAFVLFRGKKQLPKSIDYLGSVLPPAIIAILVVYCLKSIDLTAAPHGLPELLAVCAGSRRSMYGNAAIYCPSAPGRYFTCFLCRLYFPNKRNPIFVWSDSFSLHFLNDFLCYTSPNTF